MTVKDIDSVFPEPDNHCHDYSNHLAAKTQAGLLYNSDEATKTSGHKTTRIIDKVSIISH